jgi:ArsR family transcriptional regulator
MDEITTLQADILRTLASPRRLKILHRLAAGPIEVSRLADDLGLSQPNVSQHLAVLRTAGLVDADRDGREVRYRLTDPEVMVACDLMRAVLERRLRRLADLSAAPGPLNRALTSSSTARERVVGTVQRTPPLAETRSTPH